MNPLPVVGDPRGPLMPCKMNAFGSCVWMSSPMSPLQSSERVTATQTTRSWLRCSLFTYSNVESCRIKLLQFNFCLCFLDCANQANHSRVMISFPFSLLPGASVDTLMYDAFCLLFSKINWSWHMFKFTGVTLLVIRGYIYRIYICICTCTCICICICILPYGCILQISLQVADLCGRFCK